MNNTITDKGLIFADYLHEHGEYLALRIVELNLDDSEIEVFLIQSYHTYLYLVSIGADE